MTQSIKKQSWFKTKFASLTATRSRLAEWYKSSIMDIISNWHHLKYVLKNFTQSTMELGTYHLKNGNVNDAIMRFKIVDKFCEPGNELANYWLGISYYIKNNLIDSAYHFNKTSSRNAKEFLGVIENKDGLDSIPKSVISIYRDITSVKQYTLRNNTKYDLSTVLVHTLFETMVELPEDCRFLDIGASFGDIGHAINDKIEHNYHITGVEDAPSMLETLEHHNQNKQPLYDTIVQQSIRDFLTNRSDHKYSAITICNSLNFDKNLVNYLDSIRDLLKQDGYLAIAFKNSNQTHFESSENIFTYAKDDMIKQLNLANFEILIIKDLNLGKDGAYTIFICTLKKV